MMTTVRTPEWHLEQAAIQQSLAARYTRRGFYTDAERAHDLAQQHRDKAETLARAKREAAA